MSTRVLLQNSFAPQRYVLALEPDLDKYSFEGNVSISGVVSAETSKITLHAMELLISSATFTAGAKKIAATNINFDIKATTVEFVFGEQIPVGEGMLPCDIAHPGQAVISISYAQALSPLISLGNSTTKWLGSTGARTRTSMASRK